MTQNYANHVHRPTLTIVGYLFLLLALVAFVFRWLEIGGRSTFALGLVAIVMSLATLLAISRVYITRLQDRIIKLEMRMRAAALLSPDQVADARAHDDQADRRAAFRLRRGNARTRRARGAREPQARDIKRAVKIWVPDLDRT